MRGRSNLHNIMHAADALVNIGTTVAGPFAANGIPMRVVVVVAAA